MLLFVLSVILVWMEYIVLRKYNFHKYFCQHLYNDPFLKCHVIPSNIDTSLQKSSIVFAGLARNVANRIKEKIQNCVILGSFFTDYKIVIFENDSCDETRNIIKKLGKENSNILLINCEGYEDCKFNQCELYDYGIMNKNRIDKMTFFRNVYMSIIHKQFSSFQYLCVLDFDMDGCIPLSGLLHALSCPFEWSCISANGRSSIPGTFGMCTTMYDGMAYCDSQKDMENSKNGSRSMLPLFKKYLKLMYLSNVDTSKDGSGFIPVVSAFNGLCLYKIKDIHNMYYQEGYTCEHISLHEQLIKSNKKIYIDSFFVLFVGHQGPHRISDFFKY